MNPAKPRQLRRRISFLERVHAYISVLGHAYISVLPSREVLAAGLDRVNCDGGIGLVRWASLTLPDTMAL